ncbi:MAG: TauD/TfdA family dioxygenase [Pseudomonadota bacterium]
MTPLDPASRPWETQPISDAVGLEVMDIDLKAVNAGQASLLEALFNQHAALLFRNQQLGPMDLVRFSRFFGALDEAPVNEEGKTAIDDFPEIYVVSNIMGPGGKPIGSLGAGEATWHTDMSYLERPPKASMLYGTEIPPEGGNTWLAGMYAAADAMPSSLRRKVDGRRIKHDGTYNSAGLLRQGMTPSDDPTTSVGTFHPIICTHEDSGREALYLGRRRNAYIEGLELAESEELLDELWTYATQPQFTYSHTWQVGDVLMWDNRATLHRRDPFDPDARRYMLRTQIQCATPPRAA